MTASTTGFTPGGLAWDAAGSGTPIVLVHSGVADRRMWDPQWERLADRHRVIRCDCRGFGRSRPPSGPWSGHADLVEVIESVAAEPAVLVGTSFGAGLAIEAALTRPDLVRGLVLMSPGGALLDEPGPAIEASWEAEEVALDRGDIDAAVEVNLRAWVDGPFRTPAAVDPKVRAWVGEMQRHAFTLPPFDRETAPHQSLEPPATERLVEIEVPVRIILGELDDPSVNAAGERAGRLMPKATIEHWTGVGHVPSLERPEETAASILAFVRELDAGSDR